MKKLRFRDPHLQKLILSGKKDTTWRIEDERHHRSHDINPGDELWLCDDSSKAFAKAECVWVRLTNFENLEEEDKKGHERFASDEKMYKTYSGYYGFEVTPRTRLKVIKFKLLRIL